MQRRLWSSGGFSLGPAWTQLYFADDLDASNGQGRAFQAMFYQRVAGQTVEAMDRRTLSRWYAKAFEMDRTADMEADSERRQCRGLAEAWLNEHKRPDKALVLFAPQIVKGLR